MKKILLALLLLVLAALGYALLQPETAAQRLVALERASNGLEERRVQAAGMEWPYLVGGPEGAPVILMIHGFSADKDNWTRFAGHFTQDYRVVAPDLPGFGEQVRREGGNYRLGRQIERLHAFTQALGLQQFHLVGNSMGGHITALYALAHPRQVLSAGLFNNAGIVSPEPSDMQGQLEQGRNPLLVDSVEDFDRVLAYTMEQPPFIPWPVKPVIAQRAVDARAFNAYIYEQIKSDRASGLSGRLGRIEAPVLILWGRQDRLLDVSSVAAMQAELPSARSVILEDTGHLPMIERPEETATYYRAFIEGQAPAAAANRDPRD